VLLSRPSIGEALELSQKEAARRGTSLSRPAAEFLVTALECNMGRITEEIEKAGLYHGERGGEISLEEVQSLASGEAGAGLPLADAILTGEPRKILEALEGVEQKSSYLPLIVSDVTRLLRQLLVLKDGNARESGQAAKVLWGAKLPAPPNLLPGLLRLARSLSRDHLARCLELAWEAELELRSRPVSERLVVERFVLAIVGPLSRPAVAGAQR
jgi:DNA polymerase III delta subunit